MIERYVIREAKAAEHLNPFAKLLVGQQPGAYRQSGAHDGRISVP
jgi:hypothetical protein